MDILSEKEKAVDCFCQQPETGNPVFFLCPEKSAFPVYKSQALFYNRFMKTYEQLFIQNDVRCFPASGEEESGGRV